MDDGSYGSGRSSDHFSYYLPFKQTITVLIAMWQHYYTLGFAAFVVVMTLSNYLFSTTTDRVQLAVEFAVVILAAINFWCLL
jgi:hypothetical protein